MCALIAQTSRGNMMTESPFAALLDLVSFDQEIRVAYEETEKLRSEVDALKRLELQWLEIYQASQHKVKDLSKEVSAQELKMQELGGREKERREQLDQANPRDYRALKADIDSLQRAQNQGEDDLLATLNRLEVAQKEMAKRKAEYDEKVAELGVQIDEKEARIALLDTNIHKQDKGREERESRVPAEWRDKYSMMRLRVQDPVIILLDGGCSACFHAVTQQELIRLRRRELVQCQGCFRLIYHKEVMEEGKEESEEAAL